MRSHELSKRWMAMFDQKSAVSNVQFFKTGLKLEPIVHVFWSRDKAGTGPWQAWGFVVAEAGHRPFDVTEAHFSYPLHHGKPGRELATTLSGDEFLALAKQHTDSWYRNPPSPLPGKRSWEPYDDARGRKNEEDAKHYRIHCCYPEDK